jgi:hypothetical protein
MFILVGPVPKPKCAPAFLFQIQQNPVTKITRLHIVAFPPHIKPPIPVVLHRPCPLYGFHCLRLPLFNGVPLPMLVRLRTGTITFLFSVSFFAILNNRAVSHHHLWIARLSPKHGGRIDIRCFARSYIRWPGAPRRGRGRNEKPAAISRAGAKLHLGFLPIICPKPCQGVL